MLLESDSSSFVAVNGFTLFRSDAHGFIRKHGLAVYVSNLLQFEEMDTSVPNAIVFKLVDFFLIIGVVYRPPSYNELENNELSSCYGLTQLLLTNPNIIGL